MTTWSIRSWWITRSISSGVPRRRNRPKSAVAVGADETDDLVAEVWPRGQRLHDHAARRCCRRRPASARRRGRADAARPSSHRQTARPRTTSAVISTQAKISVSRDSAGIADEGRAREQQHQRQAGGREDRRQVVERAGGARQAIQPAQAPGCRRSRPPGAICSGRYTLVLDVIAGIEVQHQAEPVAREPGQVEGQVDRRQVDATRPTRRAARGGDGVRRSRATRVGAMPRACEPSGSSSRPRVGCGDAWPSGSHAARA